MANMVVEGTSVTASQLKEFFTKLESGAITRKTLQAFLERRNPFDTFVRIDPNCQIIETLARLGQHRIEDWDSMGICEEHPPRGVISKINLARVKLALGSSRIRGNPKNFGVPSGEDRLRYMLSEGQALLDASCLIAILEHQDLIPESWCNTFDQTVYFMGTIFDSVDEGRYILNIKYHNGIWLLNRTDLDQPMHNGLSVAVYE